MPLSIAAIVSLPNTYLVRLRVEPVAPVPLRANRRPDQRHLGRDQHRRRLPVGPAGRPCRVVGQAPLPVLLCDAGDQLGAGLPHGDPLPQVAHRGVFEQRREHHHEARPQVHVDALDVGDLWQGRVRAGHERGHGEHGGDAQGDAGRGGVAVQPEGHPRDDDYQAGWDVYLDQVVAHAADELDFADEARVVAWGKRRSIIEYTNNHHNKVSHC